MKSLALVVCAAGLVAGPARATCQKPATMAEANTCAAKDSAAAFLTFAKAQCTLEVSGVAKMGEKAQIPSLTSMCETRLYRGRIAQLKEFLKGFAG